MTTTTNPRTFPGTHIPSAAQTVIDQYGLTEQPTPNPVPRPGERATHTTAARLWTGTATGVDDGYDWMAQIAPLGWRPNANYGDWPFMVECFRVHDPKDDPADTGRWFIYLRLTYLERSLYLALYPSMRAARADAWEPAR